MSCNEKFWVDQVTVPHPPLGSDKGGGGYQKWPEKVFPMVNVVFPTMVTLVGGGVWRGGRGGGPPPAKKKK